MGDPVHHLVVHLYVGYVCAILRDTGSNVILPMHKSCTVVGMGLKRMATLTFKI